ncbi:MAG: prolipoprotein diacylglyceryl transferase [Planctomycetota bacterium]
MTLSIWSILPKPYTLAAWLHDLSPFAIRLTDTFGLRWYGLAYLAGFVVGFLLVRRVARVGRSPLEAGRSADFIIWCAIGAVVGGRLGYVMLYDPKLLGVLPTFPFWGVVAMHRGGMASHGGIAGACVGAVAFALRNKVPPLHAVDLLAFGAPLGLAFGRLANFVNGELFGRVVAAPGQAGPAWSVRFPTELEEYDAERLPRLTEPDVLDALAGAGVDTATYLDAFDDLSAMDLGTREKGWRVVSDSLGQLGEVVRAGGPNEDAVRSLMFELLPARHPSQLYAAALEGFLVCVVLAVLWRVPRKPGMVAAAFGVSYAVARIVNEFFRRPDASLVDVEFAWTAEHLGVGITRGQWLSVGVLIAAGVIFWAASRRKVEPLGGWRKGPWTEPVPAAEPQSSRPGKNKRPKA